MALYAVRYQYDPAATQVLDETRPAHRAWLAEQPALRLSGPTDDGGAILIFAGDGAGSLATLLDRDPFWLADAGPRFVAGPARRVLGS